MEDFEEVALGLQTKPAKKTPSVYEHIKMSENERSLISRLPGTPLYNTILRLMEGEIEKLETIHLQSWRDKELFNSTGLIAVAARLSFEAFQKEVLYQTEEVLGIKKNEEIVKESIQLSPEEFFKRSF